MTSKQTVLQFWAYMQANDFRAASALFAAEYVLDWSLTGERIRGRENFVTVSQEPHGFIRGLVKAKPDQTQL
jgi:hypothetical protein